MDNYLIKGETLRGIADAIRLKKGASGNIEVRDYPSEIENIETGGSGGGQVYVDYVTEVRVGETIQLSYYSEDCEAGTPMMTLVSCGENPDIISAEVGSPEEWVDVTGLTEGKTIVTYEYWTERWDIDNYMRTVNVQINVVSGGGSTESDAEYQYTDTINMSVADTESFSPPCPYDSPCISDYTVIQNGHLVTIDTFGADMVDITANDTGTAIIRFDYYSDYPAEGIGASCTCILTIVIE